MPGPRPAPTPDLAARTRETYQIEAERFDRDRGRGLTEAGWLERFAAALPTGGAVLDLGCGTGEPIARWLIDRGYRLTGVDFAPAMLEHARRRWPDGDWRIGDMRVLDLPEQFDGIIAWNSFFHLTADEQRACLPRLARHLKPGGALLLTVGPEAGEVTGTVGESSVFHASLSPAEYAAILEANALRLTGFLANDPDCAGHSVLLARRTGATR